MGLRTTSNHNHADDNTDNRSMQKLQRIYNIDSKNGIEHWEPTKGVIPKERFNSLEKDSSQTAQQHATEDIKKFSQSNLLAYSFNVSQI